MSDAHKSPATSGAPSATESREPRLRAVNATRGAVLATRVEWAGTSPERRRGLLGRRALTPYHALYIVPTQCIHSFGMRFPFDVAFLSPNGRVLHVVHGMSPGRVTRITWRAEGALELPAGTLRATDTRVGDLVEFIES